MIERYKVGYYDESGKRRYSVTPTQEDVIALISTLLPSSEQISVKRITVFSLDEGADENE